MANRDYEVQFKLGAEMESSFARSFSTASDEFKNLQNQVRELSKGQGTADTTRPVRDDLKHTQNEFRNTESAADRLGSMLKKVAITVGGVLAVRKVFNWGKDWVQTFANFENEMQRVRALSGATNEEFAKLTAQAKELNATTVFTGQQAAEGMAFLAMAGYETNDILAAMPGLLSAAAAGKEELGMTADIVSNILQGFGVAASDTGRVADVLTKAFTSSNVTMGMVGETMKYVAPNAKAAGISLEETAAAAGLLGNAGIQASMAGTSLRSVISRMSAPTGGAAKMMNSLGISAVNADGSLKSLAEIVEQVTEATKDMGEAQTIETVKTLVGERAQASFLSLMDAGADTLREFTKELENSDGAAQNIADTMLDSFTGSMTLFKSAVESAKISFGEKLAPVIRRGADYIAKELPKAVEKFEKSWHDMTTSPSWQKADWLEKIQIAWDRIIAKPFAAWWESSGRAGFERVATEAGRTVQRIIGAVIKEAFTGSGATRWLAAGAIALPTVKVGKGLTTAVKTLSSIGKSGAEATKGVGGASRATGLLGTALGLLTNPVGLAIAGVGALTAGVIAYRKHQEKMRQDLINMGSSLREAQERYQDVADKADMTKQLADEYRILDDQVRNNIGSAEELVEAQERMAEITRILQDMFPQTLTNYDIENGKMLDKLDIMVQMTEAEREMEKLRLEANAAERRSQQSQLEREIGNITDQIEKSKERVATIDAEKDAIDRAIPIFQRYETELRKIMEMDYSDERTAKLEDLLSRANEIGQTVGKSFSHVGLIDGTTSDLQNKLITTNRNLADAINEQIVKMEELDRAQTSYQELYDVQVRLIELDLGGKVEDIAQEYDNMSDKQKHAFNQAIQQVSELNQMLDLLPKDRKIDIEVVTRDIYTPPDNYEPPQWANKPKITPRQPFEPFKFEGFKDGGFSRRPAIFGEAGLEAAIPIDNRPRSHAILDKVNQMMGRSSGGGNVEVMFAPQITVHGDRDVEQQVRDAMEVAQEDFERRFLQMLRNERRLSFNV